MSVIRDKLKKLILSIFLLVFASYGLVGQAVEPSSSIQMSNMQLEFEALYSVENESLIKEASWSIPNILIRYGLSNNIELQLHTPFTQVRCFENNQLISNVFTFEEMEFGVSVNLWKQKKLLPEAAIMGRLVSPIGNFNSKGFGHILSLNFSNVLSNKTSISYNVGTTTDVDKNTFGFYIVNVSYQSNSNLRFFIENSVMFNKSVKSNCLGLGFGFNIINNISLDFSIAKRLKSTMFYTGAVLTWVIKTKNN